MITPEEVAAAIERGESLEVEFKRHVNDTDLVEAVVCLANGNGGWLLLGVEDDGQIVGAQPRHEAHTTDPRRVEALIGNRTNPCLSVEVELVSLQGHPVLAIRVPSVNLVGTTQGRYLRRATGSDGRPTCVPLHVHDMLSRLSSRGQRDVSALPVPQATWEDLDPLEFERARQIIGREHGDESLMDLDDLDMARALGAVEANEGVTTVTLTGLLLFGREQALRRLIPTHEVAFQVVEDTEVRVNDFMRSPLIRVSEDIYSRFQARYEEQELMVGMIRVPVPDYDPGGFREALHNALLHRDYTQLGAVHVQWYPEHVDVINPGGFPEGVRLDNLLVVGPTPRNPRLADAFKRLGLVERTGRGVDRIFAGCLRYGRRPPDYSQTTEAQVKVVLPGGPPHLEFTRLVIEQGNRKQQPLSIEELLVFHEAWQQRRMDTATAAQLIQQDETTARSAIERLVEGGLLEARGERRGRVYHLSAAVYQALGEPAAYVRTRGFDTAQIEQMILQYVTTYGRITRREVAELCMLSSNQARWMLQRMVRHGRLVMRGQRRGAWYELSAP